MPYFSSPFAGFEDEKPWPNSVSGDRNEEKAPEVALRRTQSFEADDKLVSPPLFDILLIVVLQSLTVAKRV